MPSPRLIRRWPWAIGLLVLGAGLAGCASPRGTLLPVSDTVPGASKVDMLVATTRLRATDPQEFY